MCVPLSAGSIVTGGQLLNQTNANQLAAWLGQGDLQLTNVFSSAPVSNGSTAFHTAVDGIGPTFVLIQTNLGLVGGYDPLSWSSPVNGGYNVNYTDAGRTAFIYNLTTTTLFLQRLVPVGGFDAGQYQTYNFNGYGPTFGGGHDLAVNSNNLGAGYAYSYSYGNGYQGLNLFGVASPSLSQFTVSRVEAFTFSAVPSATPEPATFGLCGGALLAIGILRRRAG